MIESALQIVSVGACALILSRAEPAVNRMCRGTSILIRVSMVLLTVGSAGMLGTIILFGYTPTVSTTLLILGVAMMLYCERRMRAICGAPPGSRSRAESSP